MLEPYNEESPIATEIRRILSKLKHANEEDKLKTVMVTSAVLGEGKSTTAAYLALAASKYRSTRTLLLDLDLRRPTIHKFFGLRKEGGVSEILSKSITAKKCLKQTNSKALRVITAGNLNQSPVELFNSDMLQEMFAEIRFYFDTVIVDAPPVIPVSDSLILGSEVDGTLFVIKAGKTQKTVVQRATQLLKDSQVKILGIILNNMQHVLPYYYDHRSYHYDYYPVSKVD